MLLEIDDKNVPSGFILDSSGALFFLRKANPVKNILVKFLLMLI